jgi:glutamyl-tRNA reductase
MTATLESLHGCFWHVASASPDGINSARAAAALHAEGAIRIATCQRIEIYSASPCQCGAPVRAEGPSALLHLAEVAAGLHAAVLGETQVLGQVRDAVSRSDDAHRRLGDIAIAAAREVRREANFNAETSQNLDHALALSGVAPGGHVLILGAGHMGKTIARRARSMGFDDVTVAVRNAEGRELPPGADRLVDLADVGSLGSVNVVVGCLGDRNGAVTMSHLPSAALYADLGTPANFSETLPNRVTIAMLVENEAADVAEERAALRLRLRAALERRWHDARTTAESPAGRLRREIEAIRAREAAAIERLHPDIPHDTVDAITRRLVNQIFHLPSTRLKKGDEDFGSRVADLFGPGRAGAAR